MNSVAVRALCAFASKRGDLDLRFTPAPTALEGIAGHARAAARRGRDYQKEVSLSTTHAELTVRGRADGFDSSAIRLDECKTYRGDLARMPMNHRALHWAQLKIYGAMLCRRDALTSVELSLVYLNTDTDLETVVTETYDAPVLERFFTEQCEIYYRWWQQEQVRRERLREQMHSLTFPYTEVRDGQQELIELVQETATQGRCLLAQAPTGIGKTLGVLFPLLQALGSKIDRIFYLTAKTPGRYIALQALSELVSQQRHNHLRVLELIAREKACVNPTLACHPDSCPLAKGFYDRLSMARDEALGIGFMDAQVVQQVALRHQICPYYLAQELARWADVIVGDYNYYFDSSAMLYALTLENDWRVAIAVDEAHNLLHRARQMYSASLEAREIKAAQEASASAVRHALENVETEWKSLLRSQSEPYTILREVPAPLLRSLREFTRLAAEQQVVSLDGLNEPLRKCYFSAVQFLRLSEALSQHSFLDMTRQDPLAAKRPTLCLRNVIPGHFIRDRFEAAHACVLFSATLGPKAFNINVLGLPKEAEFLDVSSPFDAEQLKIKVVTRVSSRYAHRSRSLGTIVETIREQYRNHPGNYLAFCSSFDYLKMIQERLQADAPDIPCFSQQPRMNERDREAFVTRLRNARGAVAFAVLGGAFAEGIDLPGDQLVGAFIATLGLPQVNPVNEAMRQCLEDAFGCGYEYTYLYPGIQKIAQAAGRIIRASTDEGTLVLLDDRYGHPELQELLPRWWRWPPAFDTHEYAE